MDVLKINDDDDDDKNFVEKPGKKPLNSSLSANKTFLTPLIFLTSPAT